MQSMKIPWQTNQSMNTCRSFHRFCTDFARNCCDRAGACTQVGRALLEAAFRAYAGIALTRWHDHDVAAPGRATVSPPAASLSANRRLFLASHPARAITARRRWICGSDKDGSRALH